jgi:general secretion pathway protein C
MNAASWLEGLPASDKWRTLVTAHGPRAATWTLALALGVQAALILTGPAVGNSSVAGNRSASAPVRRGAGGPNVASIVNAHLFGYEPPAAVPPPDPLKAPPSTIPLTLTGVIAVDDPRNGLAIIGQSVQATKVYTVGEYVPGGAKLHSVYSDHAVIDRAGHLERLDLPQPSRTGVIPGPPSSAALQTESPLVDRMRRLVNDQPGLIADIMRPQPVYQDSKLHGYRVFPGRNHQAFSRLGLRPGDLVTQINGTPLDDPARGQEILRTLNSSPEAHITVLRNGQPQDLTLNMAQVAQEAEALAGLQAGGQADAPQPAPAPPAQ